MQNTDYSKKWWVMSAVAMGVFLATIDGSIVNVALPSLVIELNEPLAVVQWVVLAYLLVVTTLMLSVGRLADIIGRKSLYIWGMAIFTIGSLLSGLSPNVYWLIGFRVLQAVGASMTQALGTAIVTDAFPSTERGRALGIIGSIVSVGIIAGPTLGGLILGVLSWHWLFFVNLPVGIFGVILATRYIPADNARGGEQFDLRGAATMFFTLASLLLALTIGQSSSFVSPIVIGLFAAALISLFAFIRIESRVSAPMIDLTMFKSRILTSNLLTGSLVFVGSAGAVLLVPFYLQDMRGFPPEQAGLMMSIVPVASGVFGPISGALSDRFGSRAITAIGLVSLIVGFVLLSGVTLTTSVSAYLLRSLPVGIGIGLFQAPNNSAIMGSARRDQLGVVSGMLSLTRTLSQTAGIAILTAVWTNFVLGIAGFIPAIGATFAPVAAQVGGFQKAIWVTIGVISAALVVSVVTTLRPSKKLVRSEN